MPAKPSPDSERRIAERAQDPVARAAPRSPSLERDLDRLFDAHRPRIRRLCQGFVSDPQVAEELVQETLLTAYRKLPAYDPDQRFEYWIFGIARNLCRNAVRKRRELLSSDGVIDPGDPSLGVLSRLRERERRELLRVAAAAVLDPREQEAVQLRYVDGLSQDSITALLGLEGSGARGLLQRCRRKLGQELRRRLDAMGHGPSFVRKTQ